MGQPLVALYSALFAIGFLSVAGLSFIDLLEVVTLRRMGRPRAQQPSAEPPARRRVPAGPDQRIAELERTIGQQQMDLDFFRAALQRVEARRRMNGALGGTTSTR